MCDERENLKERIELVTAVFVCVTAGIMIVKTFAETIEAIGSLLATEEVEAEEVEAEEVEEADALVTE